MEKVKEKDFKKIFGEYLKAYTEGGMDAVNGLIRENKLTPDAQKELEDANDLLDRIKMFKQKRMASKKSREEWEEVVQENLFKKHNIK